MSTSPESSPSASDSDVDTPPPSSSTVSRRRFLQKIGALGLLGAGAGTLLSACGGSDDGASSNSTAESTTSSSGSLSCNDVSDLSASEIERRNAQITALNYVEETPNPEQNCANCLFYQAPSGGSECGGCTLFPGPVHPNGYCTTWQPQAG